MDKTVSDLKKHTFYKQERYINKHNKIFVGAYVEVYYWDSGVFKEWSVLYSGWQLTKGFIEKLNLER